MNSSDRTIHALQDEIETIKKQNNALKDELRAIKQEQQNEELAQLLIASVQDYAIFMLDTTGHVMSWNTGAERTKGYRANEIIGHHFSTFYPPEDIATDKPGHELKVATAVGRFEDEGWRLRKDGTRFWANVIITAIRDSSGTLRGFAKVTRDMTERKQSEERLQQNIRQEETIRAQQAIMQELSTPLIPVTDKVVVMPLIGNIDNIRAQAILETLLTGIRETQAALAILDVTGVPMIDTHIANALIRLTQASKLLGTRLVLTGIRPEIAQTLVSLGVDLQGITTYGTLQRGISYALRQ